jgi:hypothetical protein
MNNSPRKASKMGGCEFGRSSGESFALSLAHGEEMPFMPKSLQKFAEGSPKLQPLFGVIEELAAATR